MTRPLGRPAGPPPQGPGREPAQPERRTPCERRRSWLRALQLGGLTLGVLTWSGAGLLVAGSSRAASQETAQRPDFTFLVAGRDVAYCGYHLRCEDQTQRENLFQDINTDTLMLVKVTGPQVEVLNIPRDTNVGPYDPERPAADQKINHQYWAGGPRALTRGVENITGSPVDAYVVLNEDYVSELIDALGGLTVTVPPGGIQWEDNAAGIHLDLPAGEQHLDGRTAALYLRVRKGVGDDWGRIDHQKQALAQLLGRLRSPQGLAVIPTLIAGFGENIETDLSPERLTGLLPYLPQLELNFATLPTTSIPGSFNLAVDRTALAQVWSSPALDAERAAAQLAPSASSAATDSNVAGGGAEAGDAAATADLPTQVGRQVTDKSGGPDATVPAPQGPGDAEGAGDAAAAALADLPVVIRDGSGALLGPALARSLAQVGYRQVRVELDTAGVASTQVLTLDAPAQASDLAKLMGVPRLQGNRYGLEGGEVAVWLGQDAPAQLAALLPLRRPTDGRQLGLDASTAAAILQDTPAP